jgi:hypothetical protein
MRRDGGDGVQDSERVGLRNTYSAGVQDPAAIRIDIEMLGGWYMFNVSADALVREITAFYFYRRRRHDEVVDAIILTEYRTQL